MLCMYICTVILTYLCVCIDVRSVLDEEFLSYSDLKPGDIVEVTYSILPFFNRNARVPCVHNMCICHANVCTYVCE